MTVISEVSGLAASETQYKIENKQMLAELISKFGKDIILETWSMLSSDKQKDILSGRVSLKTHEEVLVKKCTNLLVNQVLSAKQSALSQLDAPASVVKHHFSSYSIEQLKQMAEISELSVSDAEALQQKSQFARTTVSQNKQLIVQLERTYTKSVVREVLSKLPPSRREQLNNGTLSLQDHLEAFESACAKVISYKNFGMSEPELLAFFENAKVIERKSGYNGVIIVEGLHKDQLLKLVIKCPEKIAQETFGSKVMESFQIRSPSFFIAAADSDVFEGVMAMFQSSGKVSSEELDHYRNAGHMSIMEYLYGDTLEGIDLATVQATIAADPDVMYDKVLFELGEIAAADLLLYYKDRFPILGMGNLANAMILKSENTYVKSAAIDQVAYLTSKPTIFEAMMGINPSERVEGHVREILDSSPHASKMAVDLLDLSFPESVKEVLDKDRAEAALQLGIQSGFKKLLTIDQETLRDLHSTLPLSSNPLDRVDLLAYQNMLQLIQLLLSE